MWINRERSVVLSWFWAVTFLNVVSTLAGLQSGVAQTTTAVYAGSARVIDGDTISIGNIVIRFEGIDAPETAQKCFGAKGDTWQCGVTITQQLADLIKGKRVICEKTGEDRYQRALAVCHLEDGTELNAWLVREGLALAFVRYSNRYVKEEEEARKAKRGMWAGTFEAPWDWRAVNRNQLNLGSSVSASLSLIDPQESPSEKTACPIKGNISRNGQKIYHVPGSKWYALTQISERNGERWFCSTTEAETAGWRAAP